MQPAGACVRGGRCSGGGSGYSVAAAEFWVAAQCKFSWNCLHTASCLRIISCFLSEQNTSRNPAPCTLARDSGAEHKLLIASDINIVYVLIFSFFIVSLASYTKCLFLIDWTFCTRPPNAPLPQLHIHHRHRMTVDFISWQLVEARDESFHKNSFRHVLMNSRNKVFVVEDGSLSEGSIAPQQSFEKRI